MGTFCGGLRRHPASHICCHLHPCAREGSILGHLCAVWYLPALTANPLFCASLPTTVARWFCDITLRRLAKTLSLGGTPTLTNHSVEDGSDAQETVAAEPLDSTSGWGAASASASSTAVAFRDVFAGMETPGAGLSVWETSRAGGGGASRLSESPYRFRTFTVVCALTGVTEKGARVAEAMSPGLMVVIKDPALARCA